MKDFLNKGLWVIFFLLTPLTFIGVFSQNSIPGDFLYPVKIGIEDVGLLVFSFSPEAKASYNTTLADSRFYEAQKMILTKTDTAGLQTLVEQTQVAQQSIQQVNNPEQKKVIEDKLIASIDQYQTKLTNIQQNEDPSYVPPPVSPTQSIQTPTQIPAPQGNVTSNREYPTATAIPTATPIINTATPIINTATPIINTATLPQQNSNSPTIIPTPTPSPTPQQIVSSIQDTKDQLDTIKNQLQQSLNSQPAIIAPTNIPSPTAIYRINSRQNQNNEDGDNSGQNRHIKNDNKN